jgi:hypothetical protein
MSGIFQNPVPRARHFSDRQLKYLKGRKTDRDRYKKTEQSLQIELCQWLRDTFPGIHFRSDTASGMFNSQYEKATHNKQQSDKELPDITVFAARRGYHGLLIELKAGCPHGGKHKDCQLRMLRDGTKVRIYKDSTGKIIERDYKVRKKGDWKSLHVERQQLRHDELRAEGFCSVFAQGEEQFKKMICWYFDIQYIENTALPF